MKEYSLSLFPPSILPNKIFAYCVNTSFKDSNREFIFSNAAQVFLKTEGI